MTRNLTQKDLVMSISSFVIGMLFLIALIRQFSTLSVWESFLLAISISFLGSLSILIRRRLRDVKSEQPPTMNKEIIKAMFRTATVLVIIIGISFYFTFDQILESAKPKAPKEKLDAEVLAGLFTLLSVVTLYLLVPLLVVLIVAYSYGYGWKEIRKIREARKRMGYVYILYFFLIYSLVMYWAIIKSASGYSIDEDKILLIIAGEFLLALSSIPVFAIVLRVHGYKWSDIRRIHKIFFQNMANVEKPWWMLPKDAKEWKSINLTQHIILIASIYVALAFMLAWYIITDKVEKFVLDAAKIYIFIGAIFLPIWVAIELYGRRKRPKS